jgi:hypothetical protein
MCGIFRQIRRILILYGQIYSNVPDLRKTMLSFFAQLNIF